MVKRIFDWLCDFLSEQKELAIVSLIILAVAALFVLSSKLCIDNGGHMEKTGTSYIWIQSGNGGYLSPIDQYSCVGADK